MAAAQAKRRLDADAYAEFEQVLEQQPALCSYATTPLALSLLIELFRHGGSAAP